MKKSFILGLCIIILASGTAFYQHQNKKQNNNSNNPKIIEVSTSPKIPSQKNTDTVLEKSYTLSEISKHNLENNCWTTINNNVYDLTAWISKHPGGWEAILSICGKDGSVAFNGQHGSQGRPEKILESFKIGILKN